MDRMMVSLALKSRSELKSRPRRAVPEDFDVIFVEHGRDGCFDWYGAHKKTVTRWMHEADVRRAKLGLVPLRVARAAYVSHQRKHGRWLTRSSSLVEHRGAPREQVRQSIRDKRKVNPNLARHAAQHLRIVRFGGFVVSQAPNGDWRVGTRLLSAAQLLDLAVSKGFDRISALHVALGEGVKA